MNIFNLFRRTPKPERRSLSMQDLRGMGDTNSLAGVNVSETTALNLSVAYACINAIAQDLSSISLNVYKTLPNGGKVKDPSNPMWGILHTAPNEELTSDEFRFTLIANCLRWGNGYAEIERTHGSVPVGLHLIPPQNVEPKRNKATGQLEYKITDSNRKTRGVIPAADMLHIKALGNPQGDLGLSPIQLGKQAIGLGMAAETFGSAWFGNGSRPGGVISHPETLGDDAIKNLRSSLGNVHGGPENFGKWLILEEGAQVTPWAVPPEDAQFLSTRIFQLQEVCRYYRVPSSIINDNEHSTFSNSIEEGIRYITHCLRPWAVRLENNLNAKLFGPDSEFFCEHLLDSLMRGDPVARTGALKEQFLNGALTLDEWRAIENRNPVDDPTQHFMQGQMRTLQQIQDGTSDTEPEPQEPEPEAAAPEPAPEGDDEQEGRCIDPEQENATQAILGAVRLALEDTVNRMARREAKAIAKAASHPADFLDRAEEFYTQQRGMMAEAITPTLQAFNVANGQSFVADDLACQVCERRFTELLELAGDCTVDQLSARVNDWADNLTTRTTTVIDGLGA